MNSLDYVLEKLHVAVSILVGAASIQDRLHDAFISALMVLTAEDFPEDMRADFTFIEECLTSVEGVGDEGSVRASADALNDDEAANVADKIFELFTAIIELEDEG